MDKSYLKNNSSMKKPRRFNRQVVNTSNKINSTSDAKLISIDEKKSNTDSKSILPTRKQRIKEYLTFASEKNTATTTLLQDIQNGGLNNLESTVNDDKKPVKVKSRWTRTSLMEEALENSSFIQTEITSPKNNLSHEIINEVSTIAVTPVNIVDKSNDTMNMNKFVNNHKIDFTNSCNVVLEKCDSLDSEQIKRKRGRPKKKVIPNQEKATISSNVDNKELFVLDTYDLNMPVDSNKTTTPPATKRGRGRPKKTEIKANTVLSKPQVNFKKVIHKKKGRKNGTLINVRSDTKKMEGASLENVTTSNVSNDSKSFNDIFNSKLFNIKELLADENDEIIMKHSKALCKEKTDANNHKINKDLLTKHPEIMSCSVHLEKLQYLDKLEDVDENLRITSTEVETIDPLKDSEQDLIMQFDKANWNIVPKIIKSKSLNEYTKTRHRRNSLPNNFVFGSTDYSRIENDNMKFIKSWKSLSYLQGGPNIQIERYQQNELRKKFRMELKRSRSFPNCMLLDTVIWRFLVHEQSYYIDDNFILSDSEINLLDAISVDGYNHQYRSKSIPIELCEYKNENNKLLSRSLDSLNMLCHTKNLPPFQINPDECDLKNTESDSDECESKIRRSKRLNTKIKHTDMIDEKYFLESNNSKRDYLLMAEQIRNENERQLLEARKNDIELEEKLKKLNFTLITNNLFRPCR